jgi:hypothetical protein
LISRGELNPLSGLTKPAANEVKHAPKSGEPFLIRRWMGLWLLSAWLFPGKRELALANKGIKFKSQYESATNSTSLLRLT